MVDVIMDESKDAHNKRIKMIYHGKDYEGEPIDDETAYAKAIEDDANLGSL